MSGTYEAQLCAAQVIVYSGQFRAGTAGFGNSYGNVTTGPAARGTTGLRLGGINSPRGPREMRSAANTATASANSAAIAGCVVAPVTGADA